PRRGDLGRAGRPRRRLPLDRQPQPVRQRDVGRPRVHRPRRADLRQVAPGGRARRHAPVRRVPGHGGAAGRRGAAPADHRPEPAVRPHDPRAGRLRGPLRGPAGRRQALREVSGPGGPVGEAASVAGVWGGRAAGVLLHPTSLPGPHGVGELGPEAVRWLDLLAAAGQRVWQVLPLGPTGYGDSPYQSFSAFAGNPYLIHVSALAAAWLVADAELDPLRALPSRRVDFGGLYALKLPLLR